MLIRHKVSAKCSKTLIDEFDIHYSGIYTKSKSDGQGMIQIKMSKTKDWVINSYRTLYIHLKHPSVFLVALNRARVCMTKTFIIESINREKIK